MLTPPLMLAAANGPREAQQLAQGHTARPRQRLKPFPGVSGLKVTARLLRDLSWPGAATKSRLHCETPPGGSGAFSGSQSQPALHEQLSGCLMTPLFQLISVLLFILDSARPRAACVIFI